MVKAGFGWIWPIISESMAAQFLSFVPHGEQTLDERVTLFFKVKDRSALNTSANIDNVFPFLHGAVKMFPVLSIQAYT